MHMSMEMCFGVCRRAEHLFVGGISPPQVLSDGDKGMACGKIDRRMLCLFRLVQRLEPHHHSEGKRELGGKQRNSPEERDD